MTAGRKLSDLARWNKSLKWRSLLHSPRDDHKTLEVSAIISASMPTVLAIELRMVSAQSVNVTDDALIVDLSDGRTVSVPLAWFPRLMHGTSEERNKWRLIGGGEGIHWPDLDEDISVENLILGKPSGESQKSFKKWLEARTQTK